VQLELKGGHHAEIASATSQGPEQVLVLLIAGAHQLGVGSDNIGRDEIVDGQPELARGPAEPPPSVRPATPVVELMPSGVASPKRCASLSKSARVAPGSTRAVRDARSTRTDFIKERSIRSPPSHTALPAMLWPPLRTARSSF